MKTLILGKNEIQKLMSMRDAIRAVETAFREFGCGRAEMPSKIYLQIRKFKGDFRAMPAYLESLGRASVKWVNTHPLNCFKGLPMVMAVIILSDPKTGFPLCVMDGTAATGMRTGAAGAVAAKYLARPDSKILGLVGCGVQAGTQLEGLLEFFQFSEIRVWGHETGLIQKFIRQMRTKKLKMNGVSSIRACVQNADIVVTTTPSRKPLVKGEWLKPGVHINAIGADAPGKQELDFKILKRAKIVVDSWDQAAHGGEINRAVQKGIFSKKDLAGELGTVIGQKKKIRKHAGDMTVFDSTGLAIQDTAIADAIYRKALRSKKGLYVALV